MKYSPKDIKMAIGVASDKRYAGGNMTGAVKAIEKIKKGLSSHPQVAAVLKRQNEQKMKTFDELRSELAEGKAANPAQQAAIAIAKKEKEKSVKERTEADCEGMVCKNCGDKFGMPTEGKCMYDSKDPNGENWMEGALNKKAVETGKVKTGASKSRMSAMQKQDDNRPTLRKNEAKKQTHMFDNEKDARAKAKEIGGKYVKGTGKSAGKHAAIKEGIIGNLVKKTAKAAGGAVVNRLTTSGRAKIAQKKIDKHKTKMDQKSDIKKANDAGKSAFGFTQKQRAANAKKKLDKIAKKKTDQETIQRAKDLKKKPPVTAEGKKMDSAAMKRAMDAFKKRGGKIKKVAPGKAAGYHGKDDPGADVQGMMDRGDTKGFNRKKKVKSMGK